MGLFQIIRRTGGGDERALYECRDCGATVSPEADACPTCDSTEIAYYRFDRD